MQCDFDCCFFGFKSIFFSFWLTLCTLCEIRVQNAVDFSELLLYKSDHIALKLLRKKKKIFRQYFIQYYTVLLNVNDVKHKKRLTLKIAAICFFEDDWLCTSAGCFLQSKQCIKLKKKNDEKWLNKINIQSFLLNKNDWIFMSQHEYKQDQTYKTESAIWRLVGGSIDQLLWTDTWVLADEPRQSAGKLWQNRTHSHLMA